MRKPIRLRDYKEELDNIKQERAKLDLRELSAHKEIEKLFDAEVKDFLNGDFKVVKIERDGHKTIYGIIDRIEFVN